MFQCPVGVPSKNCLTKSTTPLGVQVHVSLRRYSADERKSCLGIAAAWITTHDLIVHRWVLQAGLSRDYDRLEKAAFISSTQRFAPGHHCCAQHLLMDGFPFSCLRWCLGRPEVEATLIYLEFVPEPTGTLTTVRLTQSDRYPVTTLTRWRGPVCPRQGPFGLPSW
jgi:hypothetical protein